MKKNLKQLVMLLFFLMITIEINASNSSSNFGVSVLAINAGLTEHQDFQDELSSDPLMYYGVLLLIAIIAFIVLPIIETIKSDTIKDIKNEINKNGFKTFLSYLLGEVLDAWKESWWIFALKSLGFAWLIHALLITAAVLFD